MDMSTNCRLEDTLQWIPWPEGGVLKPGMLLRYGKQDRFLGHSILVGDIKLETGYCRHCCSMEYDTPIEYAILIDRADVPYN